MTVGSWYLAGIQARRSRYLIIKDMYRAQRPSLLWILGSSSLMILIRIWTLGVSGDVRIPDYLEAYGTWQLLLTWLTTPLLVALFSLVKVASESVGVQTQRKVVTLVSLQVGFLLRGLEALEGLSVFYSWRCWSVV